MTKVYKKRIADQMLTDKLEAMGAVLIEMKFTIQVQEGMGG